MTLKDIKSVYFIGAGGIGMSAIARYFVSRGLVVAGYDKTPSDLTRQLEHEGILLHYDEDIEKIPHACRNIESTLVVYTPAIPAEHRELVYFKQNGFTIMKRAQVLGILTEGAPEPHRLQRFPRRHLQELRDELHPEQAEQLRGYRG